MKPLSSRIRKVFLTGLFVSLPLVITIFFFKIVFVTLDNFLGPLVTQIIIQSGAPIPEDFHLPGIGVITTVALIFLIGLVTKNYLGKKLWGVGESLVTQIPLIRSVYIGAKQVIDTFVNSQETAFSKVVMLEYPRKGIYCLAFITGTSKGEVQEITGEELVNIFVPTTPNPTSGFFLMIPKEDIVELEMSVEDGIKMIVSGGVVTPNYAPAIELEQSKPAALKTQDESKIS